MSGTIPVIAARVKKNRSARTAFGLNASIAVMVETPVVYLKGGRYGNKNNHLPSLWAKGRNNRSTSNFRRW